MKETESDLLPTTSGSQRIYIENVRNEGGRNTLIEFGMITTTQLELILKKISDINHNANRNNNKKEPGVIKKWGDEDYGSTNKQSPYIEKNNSW